jgi:sulfur-oxidizing protein SoxY
MKRRDFINLTVLGLPFLIWPLSALAVVWNRAAFEANKLADAQNGLQISDEIPSDKITIIAPARAENGAIVQVEINSSIANTEAIAIFVEKNPTALIANFMLADNTQGKLVTRIKMAETSDIKVVVKAAGRYYTASKQVQVMENGCGGGGSNEKFDPSMKMRAKLTGDTTEIKAILIHPMHTGQAKDDAGELVRAHFIQLVDITLSDKPVLQMQWGTGVAKNPYLTFYVKDAKLGDKISLTWHDNLGRAASGETFVVAA